MNSAVLVIDVQAKIFDNEPKPFEAGEVIDRINLITDKARAVKVPVLFTQHEAPGMLEAGSDGWQLSKRLKTSSDDIAIHKTTGDSFLRTELENILKSLKVDNLVICGYASEFCIDSTTRRAVGLGFTVQLLSDAHTTHDKMHLSASDIQNHHNITLSMGPTIDSVSSSSLVFPK